MCDTCGCKSAETFEAPKSKPTKSSNDFIEEGKIATITGRHGTYTGKILHIWETEKFTYMNVAFPLNPINIEMNEEEIKTNNPILYNKMLMNPQDRPKQTHWGMTLRQRHGKDGWHGVSSVKHSYYRTDFSKRKGQFRSYGDYFTCNLKTKPFNSEGFEADGKNYRGKSVNYELIPSVEIEGVGIVSEGSPYLKNNYDVKWDEYNLYDDDAGEVILSIPTNHPRMPLQEGELKLIEAMVYGFNHPLADASWGELNERGMFWAAKTMEELANYDPYEAEGFDAERFEGEGDDSLSLRYNHVLRKLANMANEVHQITTPKRKATDYLVVAHDNVRKSFNQMSKDGYNMQMYGAEGFDAEMIIDTDKYEGHTLTHWSARNVGDGSVESCDNDYEHNEPFIETDDGMGENPAIGYLVGGREAHPLEEKRANIKLIADAPKILNAYKKLLAENRRLYERMNLAEEYIRNPQSWVSYSFEVLNKNLGENEEYMMDGLKTGHKFSYRDEMGAEGLEAENEDFEFEYHVYVSDSPTDDIFIVDDARDFGTQEGAIKAAHEVSKDKRGKGKMVYVVAEEREMEIEQVIYTIDEDGDVLNAETFDAENLSFKERIEKMIDVASPKFKGIKGLGKKIGAERGKKLDYKIQGILPSAKGVSSYRRNIETPKWYKGIQLGIITGLAGFITYKVATDDIKESE